MTITTNCFNPNLQKPLKIGQLTLKNRIVMASLTRNRGKVPDELNAEYYGQRSSGGLIITEGILVEKQGIEWPEVPGIYLDSQVEGWKKVTDEVHRKGGLIFAQLWHLGRAGHERLNDGISPPAPTATVANGRKFRSLEGQPGYSTPREIEDPRHYVKLFRKAAENAKKAGFDGVELHNANGYLPHQFLESCSNQRTDSYGGSIENRCRFSLEIIDEFLQVFPNESVGIKFSPSGGFNDMGELDRSKVLDTYSYIITQLNERKISYIQLMQYIPAFDANSRGVEFDIIDLIKVIDGPKVFLNGDVKVADAEHLIKEGTIDAVVYGRVYVSNPDLPIRLFNNFNLCPYDCKSFYQYDANRREVGYTDYKFIEH